MSAQDRQRWDRKYSGGTVDTHLVAPDEWLISAVAGLSPGRALEIACGRGHNTVWLASQGWQVDAIDVSPQGLRLARALANHNDVTPRWIVADVDRFVPLPAIYDVVVVFRFLDRQRLPELVTRALAPGGHLVYETFGPGQCEREDNHLRNPSFVLAPGELEQLFSGLEILASEDAVLADRNVGRLHARRPD